MTIEAKDIVAEAVDRLMPKFAAAGFYLNYVSHNCAVNGHTFWAVSASITAATDTGGELMTGPDVDTVAEELIQHLASKPKICSYCGGRLDRCGHSHGEV